MGLAVQARADSRGVWRRGAACSRCTCTTNATSVSGHRLPRGAGRVGTIIVAPRGQRPLAAHVEDLDGAVLHHHAVAHGAHTQPGDVLQQPCAAGWRGARSVAGSAVQTASPLDVGGPARPCGAAWLAGEDASAAQAPQKPRAGRRNACPPMRTPAAAGCAGPWRTQLAVQRALAICEQHHAVAGHVELLAPPARTRHARDGVVSAAEALAQWGGEPRGWWITIGWGLHPWGHACRLFCSCGGGSSNVKAQSRVYRWAPAHSRITQGSVFVAERRRRQRRAVVKWVVRTSHDSRARLKSNLLHSSSAGPTGKQRHACAAQRNPRHLLAHR